MKRRWKTIGFILLIIVAGGLIRLPLERKYTESLRKQSLIEPPLNVSMRDKLGQTFFIAVLGGFRSAVASILELRTISAWQHSNWGVVEEYYSMCTTLQPREEHYWELRGWHLAANARDFYLWDSLLTEHNRKLLAQQHLEQGINVLKEGLQWLPKSWKLWDRLADYSSNRYNQHPDPAAGAEYYAKAFEVSGRRFLWRFHVYQVARIPEREKEAWNKLLALYNSDSQFDRTPSVEIELVYLFAIRHIYERYPDCRLPAELFKLINPASVLNDEEKRHAAFLNDRIKEKVTGKRVIPKAPVVESPNVKKIR